MKNASVRDTGWNEPRFEYRRRYKTDVNENHAMKPFRFDMRVYFSILTLPDKRSIMILINFFSDIYHINMKLYDSNIQIIINESRLKHKKIFVLFILCIKPVHVRNSRLVECDRLIDTRHFHKCDISPDKSNPIS